MAAVQTYFSPVAGIIFKMSTFLICLMSFCNRVHEIMILFTVLQLLLETKLFHQLYFKLLHFNISHYSGLSLFDDPNARLKVRSTQWKLPCSLPQFTKETELFLNKPQGTWPECCSGTGHPHPLQIFDA